MGQTPQRRPSWLTYLGPVTFVWAGSLVFKHLDWLSEPVADAVRVALAGATVILLVVWVLLLRGSSRAPDRPQRALGAFSVVLCLCSVAVPGLFLWARSRGLGPIAPLAAWPEGDDLSAMFLLLSLGVALIVTPIWARLDANSRRKAEARVPPLVL